MHQGWVTLRGPTLLRGEEKGGWGEGMLRAMPLEPSIIIIIMLELSMTGFLENPHPAAED